MRRYANACLLLTTCGFLCDPATAASDKAATLVELAEEEFGKENLTEADIKLFTAVANGEPADYTTGHPEKDDPANVDEWGSERTLDANRIVWLSTNRQASTYVTHKGVTVRGARIINEFSLTFARIPFPLQLRSCRIYSRIDLVEAETRRLSFTGSHVSGIRADGINVAGSILLRNGFSANSGVRLLSATIGGTLDCGGGSFANEKDIAFHAQDAHVAGSVFLNSGFSASGEVNLRGANIEGNLDCEEGAFTNENGNAIAADHLRVTGSVFLRNGFNSIGGVVLVGAIIGGNLECDGSSFTNENGYSLVADAANVSGNVFLRNGFNATGGVRLLGTTIGGSLVCDEGSFIKEKDFALVADAANVSGNVFLRNGFDATGGVRLVGATIGGSLECNKGSITSEEGIALQAEQVRVARNISLKNGFTAYGEVRLLGAIIGGNLECDGGSFMNKEHNALVAENVHVTGNVFLRNGFTADGEVLMLGAMIEGTLQVVNLVDPERCSLNLTDAMIGVLWDEEKSLPSTINLDGFVYKRIEPPTPGMRLKWLERRPEGEFHPQPYDQLASVLQAMGHKDYATKIRIAKERAIAKRTHLAWENKFESDYWWYKWWGRPISWGYEPWRALELALPILIFGALAFRRGHKRDIVIPTVDKAYEEGKPHENSNVLSTYPKFNSLMYSIDMFVPIIDFGLEKYWAPNPNQGKWGAALRVYLWLHIVAGWVLSTLLVIGFSGIVRD